MSVVLQLVLGALLNLAGYLIAPRGGSDKPQELQDLEAPTAEAGVPKAVVFGDITIAGSNCLWYGDKRSEVEEV